jgi:transposase
MVPILFHGLSQLGFPVICVETQQAHQALKLLAAHKTDRNDARGPTAGKLRFQPGRSEPSLPIKRQMTAQRRQASEGVDNEEFPIDPLENSIRRLRPRWCRDAD